MTKQEREHLMKIKAWAVTQRSHAAEIKAHPKIGPALDRLLSAVGGQDPMTLILDNVDWLIATLEKENALLRHRAGVRALTAAVIEGQK